MEFKDIVESLSDCLRLCLDAVEQMISPDLCLYNRATREDHLVHAGRVLKHQLPRVGRSVTL